MSTEKHRPEDCPECQRLGCCGVRFAEGWRETPDAGSHSPPPAPWHVHTCPACHDRPKCYDPCSLEPGTNHGAPCLCDRCKAPELPQAGPSKPPGAPK